jgi:hypothetical protein
MHWEGRSFLIIFFTETKNKIDDTILANTAIYEKCVLSLEEKDPIKTVKRQSYFQTYFLDIRRAIISNSDYGAERYRLSPQKLCRQFLCSSLIRLDQ